VKPKDHSRPAGTDKQGHPEPAQPTSDEQSGSTGRRTDARDDGRAKDSGQDRYGQSGFGGQEDSETMGQSRYRQSGPDGAQDVVSKSNTGSGRPDVEAPLERAPVKPPLMKR